MKYTKLQQLTNIYFIISCSLFVLSKYDIFISKNLNHRLTGKSSHCPLGGAHHYQQLSGIFAKTHVRSFVNE